MLQLLNKGKKFQSAHVARIFNNPNKYGTILTESTKL